MTVSSIDKARESWDTIDVKAVRSVAWLSLFYIVRKDRFGLSPVHHAAQFVHNLLGQRIESYRRERLRRAGLVCGDMESECLFFEIDEPVRFQEVEGYDLSSVSLERYTPRGIVFHGRAVDCNNLVLRATPSI